MATIRPMRPADLFHISSTNLDHLTETYNIGFYLEYLTRWPDLCRVAEGHDGRIEGYSTPLPLPNLLQVYLRSPSTDITIVLGKVEASPYPPPISPYSPTTNPDPNYLPWHGHITALTVAPSARRLGHATRLSEALEQSADAQNAWFVDLFVRASNEIAKELYRKMGYSVFRRVADYYNDGEDALDMRKSLSRDKEVGSLHVREDGEKFRVRPEDVW